MPNRTLQFRFFSGSLTDENAEAILLGAHTALPLPGPGQMLERATKGALGKRLARVGFTGRSGSVLMLNDLPGVRATTVVVVGLGSKEDFDEKRLREATLSGMKALKSLPGLSSVINTLPLLSRDASAVAYRHAVEASHEAFYSFDLCKGKKNGKDETGPNPALRRVLFPAPPGRAKAAATEAVRVGEAIAEGSAFAKDLGNLPPNIATPRYLAGEAQKLARGDRRLTVKILDEKAMRRLGMGALLGVAQGSREPPRLILLEYRGEKGAASQPYALVGKGITFDAGGISLKPAASMDEMKFDMSGAGAVLGAFVALKKLGLPLHVVGVVPTCENLPGGQAVKPGDILTTYSGQTVEVLNTDAEGRLILCDALSYVAREYRPRVVIDAATLTGACVVALGHHPSGLFSNDDALARDLETAAGRSLDRVWRLPLWEDYQDELKSNFADFANIGTRDGGAITAACFLWRFTRELTWAHLDVAGTAWKSGAAKGSTGRPVPLFVQYLLDRVPASRR
jgi:leucyl aminopeptidase